MREKQLIKEIEKITKDIKHEIEENNEILKLKKNQRDKIRKSKLNPRQPFPYNIQEKNQNHSNYPFIYKKTQSGCQACRQRLFG